MIIYNFSLNISIIILNIRKNLQSFLLITTLIECIFKVEHCTCKYFVDRCNTWQQTYFFFIFFTCLLTIYQDLFVMPRIVKFLVAAFYWIVHYISQLVRALWLVNFPLYGLLKYAVFQFKMPKWSWFIAKGSYNNFFSK